MPTQFPDVAAVLSTAMDEKKQVSLEYDGKERIVEPHCLGLSSKGKEVVRAYQVEGGSISGETPGWKLMSLNKIKAVPRILDRGEYPREGYERGDRGMSFIDKEI